MFQCTACYFPITFSAPPNDPHGITQDMLVGALRGVFACTVDMAPFVMPALLERLASSTRAAKLDALQTFVACVEPRALDGPQRVNLAKPVAVDSCARRNMLGGAYDVAALVPFLADLRDILRSEILDAFDVSLFFARTRDLDAIGISESDAPVTYTACTDRGRGDVTQWALRAVRCTATLVAREADHGAASSAAETPGTRETMHVVAVLQRWRGTGAWRVADIAGTYLLLVVPARIKIASQGFPWIRGTSRTKLH